MFKKNYIVAAILFFLFIIFSVVFKNLYPDFLWFESFGYKDVWITRIKYQLFTFLAGFTVAGLWLFANAFIANKVSKDISSDAEIVFNTPFPFLNKALEQIRLSLAQNKAQSQLTGKVFFGLLAIIALGLAILFGLTSKSWWLSIFSYINQVPYGMVDPLFEKDISFYLFSLPFFENLHSWLFSLLFISFLFVAWIYLSKNILLLIFAKEKKYGAIKTHVLILLSLLFLLMSFGSWIEIAELVFSGRGVVYGAGHTDVSIILPIKKLLTFLYAIQAILILFLIRKMSIKLPYLFLVGLFLLNIVGLRVIPNIIQNYVVSPNELVKEEKYIKNNIALTREAYQLNNVFASDFPASNLLTRSDLDKNNITVENIRLWNQEPLKSTFQQLQEIRLYYEFLNVDVDRYIIDGQMQQVMLSPRELDSAQLTQQAQTWVNKHLVYTHGYGLCMTPVNKITEDGLPHFYIKDLPPSTTIDLEVKRPEIYFGEKSNEFVIVNTHQKEFDYPKGNTNEYTTYAGKGGVNIGSLLNKLVFSFKFNDFKLVLSNLLKNDSKLLFDHTIVQIVNKITPFTHIDYDNDPYLIVTDEGRLVWMLDGYTRSGNFPYSERTSGGVSYVRNAVKVTIDAYDGTTKFYISDQSDPIIKTLANIYPKLFLAFDEMPSDIKNHIRYPKDLFELQARLYATYHMTDPQVFYNREDLWQIPNETYYSDQKEMKPYYLVTKLPGDKKESFLFYDDLNKFLNIK